MAKLHRRAALAGLASAGLTSVIAATLASASDTTQYFYDSLGRVIRVQFDDGSTVVYTYDAAGNRTQVARTSTPPSTAWTQTVAITGTGPVNLRTLANTAGYTGALDADVTFTLASGVTITGASPSIGIDTGTWPITQYYVRLVLQISGTVRGGGGEGGVGAGLAGSPGGDAIYCRLPMSVTVNAGGLVQSGGGGGRGGAVCCTPTFKFGGGGGGGGAPNGPGGEGGEGSQTTGPNGHVGTTSGGGAGGSGGASTPGSAGGTYGAVGGGSGGAAGYAVRKNGNPVTVTNNGTITGTVG